MARLNINIDDNLLSQLKIIAAVNDRNVTDIVIKLITDYVNDKREDSLVKVNRALIQERRNTV